MMSANQFALSGRPTVIGTGLVALDVLIKIGASASESPCQYTGGTCGNVLSILAWFGWRAVPIARLDSDDAGRAVSSDLRHFGVTTKFARLRPRSPSPIIIERLRASPDGLPAHHFSLNCPTCGSWLPRYQPVTIRAAKKVVAKEEKPAVFFFDRASPGAVFLAETYANRGALVVFEPSGQADEKLQQRALRIAHVCKYSAEKFSGLYPASVNKPLLEIQTFGSEGLRFRTTLAKYTGDWQSVPAFPVTNIKDLAGAGDWLSAGLIFQLGQKGLAGFRAVSQEALSRALNFGQSLAAWNCQFEGARGGMYLVGTPEFREQIERIMLGKTISLDGGSQVRSFRVTNFRCPRSTCRT